MRFPMQLLLCIALLGCGPERSNGSATNDGGGGTEGEGEGEVNPPGEGEGEGPGDATGGDALTVISRIAADQVESAAFEGNVLTYCAGGATYTVDLADPSATPNASEEACAIEPDQDRQITVGGTTFHARDALGIEGPAGAVDTKGPVFGLVTHPDWGEHFVSASWVGTRLWSKTSETEVERIAQEKTPDAPVLGVAASENGTLAAFGPDGITLLAVDPTQDSPDIEAMPPLLTVPRDADGSGFGQVAIDNGGTLPLHILDVRIEGDGVNVTHQSMGFCMEEPPAGVAAVVWDVCGLLIDVNVEASAPAGHITASLIIESNDPDEPVRTVPVEIGRRPLDAGDPAPDFYLPDITGIPTRLSEFRGAVVHVKIFSPL